MNIGTLEIYKINRKLEELVDPETGEVLELEAFEQLYTERIEMIEDMVLLYKNTVAEAEAVKAEADKLDQRSRLLREQADKLREHIRVSLNGEKFSTPRCTVTFRKSSSLDISDIDALIDWAERTGHDECVRYKPPEVAKQAVTDLLKQGIQVPHAKIKVKKSVIIK